MKKKPSSSNSEAVTGLKGAGKEELAPEAAACERGRHTGRNPGVRAFSQRSGENGHN